MKCRVSIIIPSYNRSHLLKWNLFSLAKQKISVTYETIVLNDGLPDETEAICRQYQEALNLRYVFTGQRNLKNKLLWRSPGFALNIAAKISNGAILIICDAEIFHINNTVDLVSCPLMENSKLIAYPTGISDRDGSILNQLIKNNGNLELDFNNYQQLLTQYPFFWAVDRDEYFAIGGYDEDFTGIAADDDDFRHRLILNDCSLYLTNARIIHLFHKKQYGEKIAARRTANLNLYTKKRGNIVRNLNREWGKIDL